ncbi:MaoC family dehydratase [Gordonia sp. KTR9]|uniref:MaoC family dehydratase n=1 Tax=Gordonia sp. KTR9 TaxID=337191 RepID=UPI00027DE779|nr:MaoC family dehydratase [Gordonia sp. KTR9]AFR50970.1 Acyl dehydratase [Gordonia sp. KTR9]
MPPNAVRLADLKQLNGSELGRSDWLTIEQERVDNFADATEDRQWIHVDPERASRESPFGGPIAHGYLTLSLLSAMIEQILVVDGARMGVNYGLNKVRFPSPVLVGSRVRGIAHVLDVDESEAFTQMIIGMTVECEGLTKPACVAEAIFRFYS